jgi:hypothetical protein
MMLNSGLETTTMMMAYRTALSLVPEINVVALLTPQVVKN